MADDGRNENWDEIKVWSAKGRTSWNAASIVYCLDARAARGPKKAEEQLFELLRDVRDVVELRSQANYTFKTTKLYIRFTAKSVRNHRMGQLAMDHVAYAGVLRRKDDLPRARENLAKAIELFTECGADGWVQRTEEELAGL